MATTYENILVERPEGAPGVALLTINRPRKLNAISMATLREMEAAIEALAVDSGVRALVITGAGERAFAAGADISEIQGLHGASGGMEMSRFGQRVFGRLEAMPKPVIAAINGYCFGGGFELALAADVRVAADTAQFAQPEIDLGIIPGFGGTQRLPRVVGRDRAKKLMMTGERFSAAEAYRLGVIDHIAPADQLMLQALNLAAFLAAKAPIALALIKEAVNLGMDGRLQDGLELESQLFGRATATTDRVEGTTAFLEKRKPVWTGRVAQETDALLMSQPASRPTIEPDEDPSNTDLI